jgi:dTDP-4-dehydrorhamnose reductase
VAPPRAELDLTDAGSVRRWVEDRSWAAIINAGAWTAVDAAETHASEAWAANALGPALLARAAAERGLPLVHISTDYVFDGGLDRPYREDDPVGPVSVYGASKAAGEMAVAALNPRHVILRTAWVYSPWGTNFARTMLRLAETRDALSVINDQAGCPTSALDIAGAIGAVCRRLADPAPQPAGVFHFAGAGETTWYGFAARIFERAAQAGVKAPALTPIPSADWPTPVRRPANSRLDTTHFTRTFGLAPRPWTEAVDEVVDRLTGAGERQGGRA